MSTFIDALFEPDRHCACGHHEGSHNHGFTGKACMWCECREFVDAEAGSPQPVGGGRPPMRRSLSLR